ncbi:hypothetical protein [Aeromicrobium sp. UC242_57]|uniref:hypothetical protein n=1 Tax=Aeromicrobium sp. UC242_57 TaxID=3374624 RepID=UPI00378EE554
MVVVRQRADADVCDYDPGFEVDVSIATDLRTMTEIWRGDRHWADALRIGDVSVKGPAHVQRDLPVWLGQMQLRRCASSRWRARARRG